MDREIVLSKVREIAADHFGLSAETITEASHVVDDLGADSLDQVELVMSVEEEFGLMIDDADAAKFTTIKDVVDYVMTH